jgi:hypothetical protein
VQISDNFFQYEWEAMYYALIGYTKYFNNYSYNRHTSICLPKNNVSG